MKRLDLVHHIQTGNGKTGKIMRQIAFRYHRHNEFLLLCHSGLARDRWGRLANWALVGDTYCTSTRTVLVLRPFNETESPLYVLAIQTIQTQYYKCKKSTTTTEKICNRGVVIVKLLCI